MMNSSRTATKTMTGAPRHLQRSRSAEDLSREQLKSTEKDTVLIFIEYVRKKVGNYSSRAAEVDEERDAERRQRERRLYGGEGTEAARRKRGSLRRHQSEPNGPKSADAEEGDELPQLPTEHSLRPTRLVLERPPSNRDERKHRAASARSTLSGHSNSSGSTTTPSAYPSAGDSAGSSNATTPMPIPDPPLGAGGGSGLSPCDEFASSSYPPLSAHRLHSVSAPVPPVVAGLPVSQEHFCTAQQPLTPQLARAATKRDSTWQKHHAKIIANKLKIFGDEISSTHEEELQREIVHLVTTHTNPQQVISFFSAQLRQMLLGLSWQNIGKVFHLSYHLIEFLTELLGSSADVTGSREWAEFSELWDLTLGSVTRWIWSHGGWRAFPADPASPPTPSADQPTCPATPSFRRVRSRLLSLSENGEFEFVDEEGYPPLSADTISTTSSEVGLSDDREDRLGSSVDLLENPLQESPLESSLTTSPPHLPATLTPVTVPPPCTHHTPSSSSSSSSNHTHFQPSPRTPQKRRSLASQPNNTPPSFPSGASSTSNTPSSSSSSFSFFFFIEIKIQACSQYSRFLKRHSQNASTFIVYNHQRRNVPAAIIPFNRARVPL